MSQKKQGILFIIMAGMGFATMSFLVRLSGDLPTMQKAFFRNFIAAIVAFVMLMRQGGGFKIQKGSGPALFARCALGTMGLICNFYALDKMNIADANILNKLSPFFAIIMSYFILNEKANKVEWACVAAAFTGALFIVKPSFHVEFLYSMIGVLGGFGAGAAYTFVRKLGTHGESGPIIVLAFSVFSSVICLPFMILNFAPMSTKQLIFLIVAGVAAAVGQLCITAAYTKAPAREISVFDYSQVVFAALLGFAFLGQVPDTFSVIGYIIIIGCAVFKWWYMNQCTES